MKRLDPNGLWQTKMMLPEHKEAIMRQSKESTRIVKPELDEQQINYISAAIGSSKWTGVTIDLTVFDEYSYREIVGTVDKVDQQLKQIKVILIDPLATEDDYEWIPMGDIVKAEARETKVWEDFEIFDF
jgi:hypothetical protein